MHTFKSMHSFANALVASIVANLVVSHVVVHVLGLKSTSLRAYYAQLHARAVLLDITSVLWGTLLAQRVAGCAAGCVDQIVAAVAIQLVHDVAFGIYLRDAAPESPTMTLFREYAKEHGKGILSVDAVIMIVSVVLSRVLATWEARDTTLLGTVALYTHLLFLDAL